MMSTDSRVDECRQKVLGKDEAVVMDKSNWDLERRVGWNNKIHIANP